MVDQSAIDVGKEVTLQENAQTTLSPLNASAVTSRAIWPKTVLKVTAKAQWSATNATKSVILPESVKVLEE